MATRIFLSAGCWVRSFSACKSELPDQLTADSLISFTGLPHHLVADNSSTQREAQPGSGLLWPLCHSEQPLQHAAGSPHHRRRPRRGACERQRSHDVLWGAWAVHKGVIPFTTLCSTVWRCPSKMLDGLHQGVDVPAHAWSYSLWPPAERLEQNLPSRPSGPLPPLPLLPTSQLVKGLNWASIHFWWQATDTLHEEYVMVPSPLTNAYVVINLHISVINQELRHG